MTNNLEPITQAEARELSLLGMEAVDFLKCCYRAIRTAAEKGRPSVKVPAEVHWIHDMEFESELHGVIQRLKRDGFRVEKMDNPGGAIIGLEITWR